FEGGGSTRGTAQALRADPRGSRRRARTVSGRRGRLDPGAAFAAGPIDRRGPSTVHHPESATMNDKNPVSRRGFLGTAGLATGAVVASGTFAHPAIGKVKGANEKVNFAILGPGGRA